MPALGKFKRSCLRESEDCLLIENGGRILYRQEHLAQNIRKYRLLAGLTQAQLAKRMFVSAQNIYKWETGKTAPSVENLYLLSQTLDVSADDLLGDTDGGCLQVIDD